MALRVRLLLQEDCGLVFLNRDGQKRTGLTHAVANIVVRYTNTYVTPHAFRRMQVRSKLATQHSSTTAGY